MEETRKSGFGTAALVLGIIGVVLSFIPIINNIAFILGVLAFIFAIVSLSKKASKGMAIAGLVLAIFACFITYSMQSAISDVFSGNDTSTSSTGKTTQDEKTEYNQGEEAILGKGAITVTKVQKSQGTQYDKPKSGKEFVIVYVTIENKGSSNLSYNPYYFKMQNSQGQQESRTFTIVDNDTSLQSGELIPGGKVSGTIVFEQPKGDTGLVLIYNDSIWSSKELKINIK